MDSPPPEISRAGQLQSLAAGTFDVLILGGGITGVCAAHVLTARGYKTALIDNHDFASGTSQESSQLIWGGIKYMESGHFKLVDDLCRARNALVREYPSRVAPLRFLYPHYTHDRHGLPTLLAGAWLYWGMGRGFGGAPRRYNNEAIRRTIPAMRDGNFNGGFEYADARMVRSDARLVIDLLLDTVASGLTAVNYLAFEDVRWNDAAQSHEVTARDEPGGGKVSIRARWIVNTTGVWVDQVNEQLGVKPPYELLYSKGIHLIIPRIETGGKALTCLAKDGRPFFVIPWGDVTLVGTTDTPFAGPPQRVNADKGDIAYLRSECETKFNLTLTDSDILNTKAGLRPLLRPKSMKGEDFLSLARSHKVWSEPSARVTALWGGKYTDAFPMAREIAGQIAIPASGQARPILMREWIPPIDEAQFVSGSISFDALATASKRELVVKLEDLLRRRTNIGLKVASEGRGIEGECAPTLKRISEAIGGHL